MLKKLFIAFPILLLAYTLSSGAYSSITPADVHARLMASDTFMILDVREWSEYTAGHIAEPAGLLPFTPACMPWNTGILAADFHRLPKNIDIIVHCLSGGRSAAASKFLSDSGYTRIFNMTGGFNAWTFEKRTGGFGDHSGHWVRPTMPGPDTVRHDSGAIGFYPASLSGLDSLYCELHFASGKQPVPADAPESGINGLYRLTALDKFGLSLFKNDTLALADTAGMTLRPQPAAGLPALVDTTLLVHTGSGQWSAIPFDYTYSSNTNVYHQSGRVIYRWYDIGGYPSLNTLRRPSAQRRETAAAGSPYKVCDLRGRAIYPRENPGLLSTMPGSGYYIMGVPGGQRSGTPLIRPPLITPSTHHGP